MVEQLLDPFWYRAENLKPRLRPHVRIHRHLYRGQRWYVIQDAVTGRFHRFPPLAYRLIGLMDGRRTVGQIWQQAADILGDDVPTQRETLRLLHQLHELGHAYAVKRWGGEVHQIGVMFLVFLPVPYVDASASTAFRSKYQRALVGAAGMLVEVFLASLALFLWLLVEPGLVKAMAFNVMVIAGVSTLLFNGNPLLRFDAYYILSDLIEIPNLDRRSFRYVWYLVQRYAFRVEGQDSPVQAHGEAAWFLFYAPASFAYRMFIFFAIVTFVAGEFFFFGVLIALWASINLFAMPVFKGLKYLSSSPALTGHRRRAWSVTAAVLGALALLIVALPLPLVTIAEGVLWAPEGTQVRSSASGFVTELRADPGSNVARGDVIVVLDDPLLEPELAVLYGELAALEARFDRVWREDRVRATIVREQIDGVQARIARKQEQLRELLITAPASGLLVLPRARDLQQRFVRQGTLLGHVIEDGPLIVRAVVTQDEVDLVRHRTQRVDVRLTQRVGTVLPAHIEREVPSASLELPSVALGTSGGGRIAIDLRDANGAVALENVFLFDLIVVGDAAGDTARNTIGSRVYVRFDHGLEPIGWTWYRSLRRLFLRYFDV